MDPEGTNVEADELSNGVVHRFKMENRVECNIQKLEFVVLNEMLDFPQELYSEADARKAKRKQAATDGQDRNAPAIKSLDDLQQRDDKNVSNIHVSKRQIHGKSTRSPKRPKNKRGGDGHAAHMNGLGAILIKVASTCNGKQINDTGLQVAHRKICFHAS